MKKKFLTILLAITMMFTATACGGNTEDSGNQEDSGSSDYIKVEHTDLGSDFNSQYYPVSSKILQRSGTIDLVIQFDGTETAWKALASEYERLHSNAVTVNVGVSGVQSNYKDRLNTELSSGNSTWDIIQGNLVNNIESYCVDMGSAVNKENGYAGGVAWKNVLTTNAYQTDTTGASSSTYIMNSQNLQTCWFINTVAFNKAQVEANKDSVTLKQNPTTWDELLTVCKYMQEAGYKYPLGISLDDDSIDGYQFSWLLRIYGDFYYRNEYDNIMTDSSYKVDVKSQNPESDFNYGYDITKLYNVILDNSATNARYCGATSAKYKEFVGQFEKMKDYLSPSASSTSLETMRNSFKTQSLGNDGDESPQIILDYAGSGLAFNTTSNFTMDFFDYPTMVSAGGYIDEGTIIRDVGGNGGYLSILKHDTKQNELNIDFIKFVMSPYGQTIFYNALSKTDVAPQGITTVKNNLVIVPAKWTEFFNTTKISFTGLSDVNEFIRNLIRSLNTDKDCINLSIRNWRRLLIDKNITIDTFSSEWHTQLLSAWTTYATAQRWNVDCYKTWGGPVN